MGPIQLEPCNSKKEPEHMVRNTSMEASSFTLLCKNKGAAIPNASRIGADIPKCNILKEGTGPVLDKLCGDGRGSGFECSKTKSRKPKAKFFNEAKGSDRAKSKAGSKCAGPTV